MLLKEDCPPTYPSGCKIVFCGEAPGLEEAKAAEGWVGPAGNCLQKAANLAGIEWATVGKTNVAKRYPGKVPFQEAFYETKEESLYTKTGKVSKKTKKSIVPREELNYWKAKLLDELRLHKPNLVVACGAEALKALTEVTGITNYRGSVLRANTDFDCKVLAVEHPSYIIRGNHLDFWILAMDLKKARREMEFPEIRRVPFTVVTKPCIQEVVNFLRVVRAREKMLWTLDVETRAGTLACFAIGWKGEITQEYKSLCVPVQTTTGPYWSLQEEAILWEELSDTLKANPYLCNQNITYDIDYLLRYRVEPSGVWMDTMLAHSLLYPEFPKSLDFLASIYLDDVVYWKDDHREWSSRTPDEALWEYNCKDAVYTLRIVEKIDEELKRRGMWEMYHGRDGRAL